MSVFLDFDVFSDYYIRTEVERQTDNQTKSYLPDDLKLSVKSFFVFDRLRSVRDTQSRTDRDLTI